MSKASKTARKGPDQSVVSSDLLTIGESPVPGVRLRRVLREHTGAINDARWSPDGRYIATCSDDMRARIWDVESGICISVLEHGATVFAATWSPDGRRLATLPHDKTVRIWNIETWKSLTLTGAESTVADLAWAPDGRRIALASMDTNVRVWDVDTGKPLAVFKGHTDTVRSVAWSPDGKHLVSGSYDNTVRVWSMDGNEEPRVLRGHAARAIHVRWSPDGRTIASSSSDMTVRLWGFDEAGSRALEAHTGGVIAVAFSPDGTLLATKSLDHTVRVWNLETWKVVATIPESSSGEFRIALDFHPHTLRFVSLGEKDTVIRIWDVDPTILLGSGALGESVPYTTAKLVLVGDSGVGKTGLGWRLAHGNFKEHASTHGQQFWVIEQLSKRRSDGTECEAVLWDLAGQHVYRPVHAIFLENVDLALLLFDPTNRQEPLKGVEFWLEQLSGNSELPPTVLVGARVDRGAPVLSREDFEQFCQRHRISGGYVDTSAMSGAGLDQLLDILKHQIPWDRMTATVTTVTFKRIKEHVLALKEKPDWPGVLVRPPELRQQLQDADAAWQFTDAEMMTAVRHLETHGYVALLRSSSGEEFILLRPEILVELASSIVLQADKHPRELGAVSETALLQGGYSFAELAGLQDVEQQILLDAAVARFLGHSICFRETLGAETLLIFPGLIKQKRPLVDDVETEEDVSYIVRGRVENVYAALVVLLGYTPTFTRINQWQNQAQYERGKGELCGFRLIEEREGEIELVLYYSPAMPAYGRTSFQGLFESFLYQRDVEVTSFPPVVCPDRHRQERATVVKRLREGKKFLFCEECGKKISLPELERPLVLGAQDAGWVQREEGVARLRSAYETHLVRVKSFRRDRAVPRCYISHAAEQDAWVSRLKHDLREAGVLVVEDLAQVHADDFIVVVGTPAYREAWERGTGPAAADNALVRTRLARDGTRWPTLIPLVREGKPDMACLPELGDRLAANFRDDTRYAVALFDLVLSLYAIPLNHRAFEPFRTALQKQWEETLAALQTAGGAAPPHTGVPPAVAVEKEVFISYAWGDASEAVANDLDRAFQARGVTIVRDKRDLGFKGSIREFMDSIGQGKCVVLIISDKYLKSANCLYELLQVARHGELVERIFPVVLEDARIYDPVERIQYVQYWEQRHDQLDAAMKSVDSANLQGFREDIDLMTEIRALLPRLADLLKDMNTLTPEMHRGSNFTEMFNAVMARLSA